MSKKTEVPGYTLEPRIEITGKMEPKVELSDLAKALGAEEVTDPKEIAKWRMKGGAGFLLVESWTRRSRKG